jgi:hypothetical protein
MDCITAMWSAIASVCLIVASVHFIVWVKSQDSMANLLLSISASSAAIYSGFELSHDACADAVGMADPVTGLA